MAFSAASFVFWPVFSRSRSATDVVASAPFRRTMISRKNNLLAMASNEVNNPTTNSQNDIVCPAVANFPPSSWGGLFSSFNMDIQLSDMYTEEIEVQRRPWTRASRAHTQGPHLNRAKKKKFIFYYLFAPILNFAQGPNLPRTGPVEVLREEARNMLISHDSRLSEKLVLIDTVERLGLSHHFENEITQQLTLAFNGHFKLEPEENDALQFRLMRQHFFDAPSSIFKRFTESNGEFKKGLSADIEGVLSLYEASYIRKPEDEILDKAFSFCKAHLESVAPNLPELPLKKQVLHALDQSLVRGIPRFESPRFISLYEEVESKNESLSRLAKLDFNLLQMQHKQELCEVMRWWKEMDLISMLPYARDRVVECYFSTLGVYHEPQYSNARVMLAKSIAFISMMDDTYDSYGTIEELKVFTEAIQKWDISEMHQLPDYMKIYYRALLNFYEDFDAELSQKGRSYAVHYAREATKEMARSYYAEATWFVQGRLTVFQEYMSEGNITSACYYLTVSAFLGMDRATSQVFNWLSANPKILQECSLVTRIINDISSYEDETKRGQIATGIDCYMKEHGVSKQVAIQQLQEIAEDGWKELNQGLLDNSVSSEFLMIVFNLLRVAEITYKHKQDGYTYPEKGLKPHILALLIHSFKI